MRSSFDTWFSEIKKYKRKLLISLFFLVLAIIAYIVTGDYVSDRLGSVVSPDLILDFLGPYDLSFLFIWLFLAMIILFFGYPLLFKPRDLPYAISMFSFFVMIRSLFISFTHLRVPYDAIHVTFPGYFQLLNFSNTLFFSGHVGISFLGFLIFEDIKWLRYFMLTTSIILGITVLLMHVHYSIDVFSAYFITYGIYHIGNRLFKR